jgi:Mannosyltransferase (PIG-V)
MIERVVAVGQRVSERRTAAASFLTASRLRPTLEIFIWSRVAIWLGAVFAFAFFEPDRHPQADRWDTPLLHENGWPADVWARWDSAYFVRIAAHGYDTASAAFFPLYPALLALGGRALGGRYVLAGLAVSLAACLGAFVLLHRLAEERLGVDGARRAVLYVALFPMSLFLQAVYSDALFLLLALGAFVLAERGHFGLAGVATGLALLTRLPAGVALAGGLAVLAWRSRDRLRAFASLALAPVLFAFYPLYLAWKLDDAWAFARVQGTWNRHLSPAGPLGGIWDALTKWTPAGADPRHAVAENLQALAFLALFAVLTVVAWRRFGAPYGVYCVLSLAIPLSVPSERWPLLSLPRFGLVVFPFFLALAALGGRPRVHTAIVGISSLFLGIAVAQWALWQWVA